MNRMIKKIERIEGWLQESEALELCKCAKEAVNPIVEVGSYCGKSSVCLGTGAKWGHKVKVYCVDRHTGSEEHRRGGPVWTYPTWQRNIFSCNLVDSVIPLVMDSIKASEIVEAPISMLFIDGSHDYKSVLADYEAWSPKLESTGIIAFHDFRSQASVQKVVYAMKGFEEGYTKNITYFARKK